MDGSLGSYSNHTLNPWSRYCCNALMQSLSNATPSPQSSSSSYQQNSDLYYSQTAQSSNYYPSFFQQRLTLSSTLSPFHSHLTSCYQSSTNDVGYRPLSTFPPIPEARTPYWFSSLDSCASLYGNSFYRFFPSPSQASLPPISPSSDHFYPRTASLPSPFALSSAKSSHCCTDLSSPPPVVTSQTEVANVDARDNLTVRVKTESQLAATTFSSPVKCTAQCCSPSFQRNSYHDQIKQESFNRDSEGYLIATRFPSVCPPNLEEAQQRNEVQPINYHKSIESKSHSNKQKRNDDRPFSAIVAPFQKSEKQKSIFKDCRKSENFNSMELEKQELPDIEKPLQIKSLSNAIPLPKLDSQETKNSIVKKCSQSEDEAPACLSKVEKEATVVKDLPTNIKKNKHNKPSLSSQVPVGIAIARKRHTSPTSKRNSAENKNTISSLEMKQHIQNVVKEQKPLEPNNAALKSEVGLIDNSTPATMTISPDYRLARDSVTGQFYLISTAATFIQSQLVSNSEQNIPSLDVTNPSLSNIELPTVDRDEDKMERKVVEQATQACLSDEENEQLLISSNCVTSSVQVDMDAEDEPLSLCVEDPIIKEEDIKRSPSPVNDWKQCDSDSLSPKISDKLTIDSKNDAIEEKIENVNSSVCTDGLNLLSALAEQRSLEERRRHSTDGFIEKVEAEEMNIDFTKPVKKRQRSESCISAIDLPKNDTSNATHLTQNEGGVKKKRKYSNSSDPWMIRRSERIFLNEALQQSQNSANTHLSNKPDSSHNCKLTVSKKIKSRKKSKDDCKLNVEAETDLPAIEETSDEKELKCRKHFSADDFKLKDDFLNNQRIIIKIDDLLYAGSVSAIQAPDVYGITLDGERSQHKHIYSREDVLKEAIIEIKPENKNQIPDGTRVCAYWSQQYKCLYAGRVAICASPNPLPDRNLIFVEFDDGDKGRIPLNDVRLLPQDYPLIKSARSNPHITNKRNKVVDENVVDEKESIESSSLEVSEESGDSTNKVDSSTESSEKSKKKKKHCKGIKKHHRRHKHRHCKHHKRKRKHKKKDIDTISKVESTGDVCKKNEAIKEANAKHSGTEEKSNLLKRSQRRKDRISSSEKSKIAPFLPLQQLWHWSGKSFRKVGNKGKTRKEFYKAIHRGKEVIKVGDSAVFLSTGRPNLPYVGKIDSMWQSGNGNMIVKVKWFYHPEETKAKPDLVDIRGALFESSHYDENDVQTISHKCEVILWEEYDERRRKKPDVTIDDPPNIYYLGGSYDPLVGKLQIASKVPLRRSLTV